MSDTKADWTISSEPSSEYECWAGDSDFLFTTPDWASVVATLGAESLYAWNRYLGLGLMVPVFRRYGLRIGFFGFPVTCAPWAALGKVQLFNHSKQISQKGRLDVMRLTQPMNETGDTSATASRPEAWINNLHLWSADSSKRLRKDLAFARRASSGLHFTDNSDADACFRLYTQTVLAHSGSLRYNLAYFRRLLRLSESNARVRFFSAFEEDGIMRGFVTLAVDGATAYYLHGAVDEVGRRQGVSDLLLEDLVCYARSLKAQRLSLMASPWDQPGLLNFKAKWANVKGLSLTYDVGEGIRGKLISTVTRWLHRQERNLEHDFLGRTKI